MSTIKPPACDNYARHSWTAGTRVDMDGALWLRVACTHCGCTKLSGGVSYCGRPKGRTRYEAGVEMRPVAR